jgi:DNA invertase Pin-like site-specific DNA recombinase
MKSRRAAIICRTSTVGQSNVRQVEELTALAEAKGFLVEPEDIYEDQISGFSKYETRPALNRLLETIQKNPKRYQMAFAMEVSRISRDPDEGQKILLKFSEANIPIYVKNISMCTHLEGEFDRKGKLKRNQMFGIVFTLLQEFAATEAEYIRERSISGMRSKKMKGHAGGGVFIQYGYRRDPETKLLEVDEDERKVVEDIFNYASRGYGLQTICNILNDSKIPTKSQKVVSKGTIVTKGTGQVKRIKKVEHIRWEPGTIQTMLTNSTYCGKRKIKTDEKLVDGKRVPIYSVVPCPANISEDLFERVQKLRSDKYNRRSTEMRYLYLLKNICTCGFCGRNMVGRYKPGTDAYYQCSGKRTAEPCENISPNIEALESTVYDVLYFADRFWEYLKGTGTQLQEASTKIERLNEELLFQKKVFVELEREKANLKILFRKGVIDDEEFDTEWKKLVNQTEKAQFQVNNINRQLIAISEMKAHLEKMDDYLELVEKFRNDRFQAAQVFNNVVERVVVTSAGRKGNQYHFLVSIFIKYMTQQITVLMITKQRNQRGDFEIPQQMIASKGQSRFIYHYADKYVQPLLEYTSEGIFKGDMECVVDQILAHKETKVPKEVLQGKMKPTSYNYIVPKLIPFDERNIKNDVPELTTYD